MKRSKRLTSCAAIAVLALSVGGLSTANATPETTSGLFAVTTDVEMTTQEGLDAIADHVRALPEADNLAGLRVDVGLNALNVWWVGPVPSGLKSIQQSSAPVRVVVEGGTFTRTEMIAASESLLLADDSKAVTYVSSASARVDGTGIDAVVSTRSTARAAANLPPSSNADLSAIAGMPVFAAVGDAPVAATRWNDSSPWYGGGAMTRPVTGGTQICSVGFGVNIAGAARMLSAAHCDTSGNAAWNDGAGDSLTLGGAAVAVKTDRDSLLFDPVGGNDGWVHGGPWNATSTNSRYHLRVATHSNNNTGDSVCASGAVSGEHCSLTITNDAVTWYCLSNGVAPVCTGSTARNTTTAVLAVAQGDSGGPVYANRSDGRVTARGIISAQSLTTVTCPSTAVPTVCSRDVYYYPIEPLLTAWGVALEVA